MAEANQPQPASVEHRVAITRVDWIAVAPWVGLLKSPGYALGTPWLLCAAAALLVGPWPGACRAADLSAAVSDPVGAATSGFAALYASVAAVGLDTGLLRAAAWSLAGLGVALLVARRWTLGDSPTTRRLGRTFVSRALRLAPTAGLIAAPVLVAILMLVAVGVAARIDFLAPIVAAAWPLKWIAGLVASIAGCAALAGWPLALAAIAIDDADPFDAASRLYAYVLQRPARLGWYITVAAVVGLASAALVEIVAAGTLAATHRFVEVGHGGPLVGVAASIAHWWDGVLRAAVAGYYPAYVFTAAVGVYLLLRRDVDGQPIDERAPL
jgi:hypothetical protein